MKDRKTPGSHSFHLQKIELLLILAGLLFFANVIYIAVGGGFSILYAAKILYALGIFILTVNYIAE